MSEEDSSDKLGQELYNVLNQRNHRLFLAKLVILGKIKQENCYYSGLVDEDLPPCQNFKGVNIIQVFRNQVLFPQESEETHQDRCPNSQVLRIINIDKGIHLLKMFNGNW